MKSLLKYDVIRPPGRSIKHPIIMLHGFFGDRAGLSNIAKSPLISSDRTIFLLDLRNHGDSPWMNDMHFDSMTGDVLNFMSYVGIQKAIWMGHSYGAKIGYVAALKHPNSCSAVISLDIAPMSYESKLPQFTGMMKLFKKMESETWRNRREIEQFVANESPTLTEKEIKFLTKHFVAKDSEIDENQEREWEWRHNVDVMIDEMENIVDFPVDEDAQYHGPAYLFRGQFSKWADENTEDEIYRRFPNMKITTVEDAGHNVHTDQPEATVQYVYEALNEIDIDFDKARGPVWDEILRKRKASGDSLDEQVC